MASPLLDHCPPSLPARAYLDADWYLAEQSGIWRREWVYAGRLTDLAPASITRRRIGGAEIILCNAGSLTAYHNTCRHRGAELCATDGPSGRLITCPYHAWAYAADDGRLVSTAHATPTADFRRADHGLHPVNVTVWNGCVFVNLSDDPVPLAADPGLDTLTAWPVADLSTGFRHSRDLACNWKVFWENYNECLHCPGIHPEL